MNMSKANLLALVCVGVLGTLVPQAKADEWNQKTIMTFNTPVEIPGQVLMPGTYVFKLADSQSDRNIVQVFNKDENHLYGTFLAVPDYHLRPSGKPIITFEERAAGAPPAVRAWFWPGDYYGHQFVYPKSKARELAKLNRQTVASMPNELAANTTQSSQNLQENSVAQMRQAPLTAQQPSETEVEITEAFPAQQPSDTNQAANNSQSDQTAQSNQTAQSDQTAQSNQTAQSDQTPQTAQASRDDQAAAQPVPQSLPQTGSSLPLIGLLGLMALGTAGALSLAAAKVRG
jgi:chemotaxis protein histidine kinase CheA